jgi:chemotaxis protein CheD
MELMVRMGELKISDTPGDVLVSLGLGSCIGLALIDRRAGAAGLAHIVLPETTGSPAPEALHKFADHAVPALFDGMRERGASRVFMEAVLVGGASMFAATGTRAMEVGLRNAEAVCSLVAARRVPVVAEAVGGSRGRTIRVDVASGDVTVREAGGSDQPLLGGARSEVTA